MANDGRFQPQINPGADRTGTSATVAAMPVSLWVGLRVATHARANSLLIALAVVLLAIPGSATAGDLDEHLWTHRLLVLIAPEPTDAAVELQQRMLEKRTDALIDRDIHVYQLYQHGTSLYQGRPLAADRAARLRVDLAIKSDTKALFLVGKDGTVKRRTPLGADLRNVFMLIDEMPMRRAEIREKFDNGQPVTLP